MVKLTALRLWNSKHYNFQILTFITQDGREHYSEQEKRILVKILAGQLMT
jgi:hypothetical protein